MNSKNIKKVRELVEKSDLLQYKPQYVEILDRWEKGDFTQAVEEHNFFGEIQGGNTGKVYKSTNPEQEKEFIQTQGK
ncbi:DUF6241 domain-containing protein [Bacillus pseudomycoides]|uniref:DUF6241 domain-containing protein n=1 Tax=Bacillus pseudomycoides TaxID=64104 RepID=UPI000BECA580|nr:DUF6241 domain-containing protein [Bacillus pseudomycoides]PEE39518.1 hypothetical protein COO02_18660 [Bacillus pseudomycoides]PGA92392.1 hypothetical protein COL91_07665 [Bacillus pseudomycoides]PHF33380.1 hypothetical protein COF72_27550 [Bacillus pseudomycoides]